VTKTKNRQSLDEPETKAGAMALMQWNKAGKPDGDKPDVRRHRKVNLSETKVRDTVATEEEITGPKSLAQGGPAMAFGPNASKQHAKTTVTHTRVSDSVGSSHHHHGHGGKGGKGEGAHAQKHSRRN